MSALSDSSVACAFDYNYASMGLRYFILNSVNRMKKYKSSHAGVKVKHNFRQWISWFSYR